MRKIKDLNRTTTETNIDLLLMNLDGEGEYNIKTGIPFFDHMLELFSKHSSIDLNLNCKGDIEIDSHHSVEDIGLVLGDALSATLANKKGINRYGSFLLPMDEALVRVVIDLGGRPYLVFKGDIPNNSSITLGNFQAELVEDFFKAFSDASKSNIHIEVLYGRNSHHIIEGIFKGFARALKEAITITGNSIPSTKGII